MTSPQQAAAARWEEDVARFERDAGLRGAERLRVKHPDRGDIGGVPDWTQECKGLDKMQRRKPEAALSAWAIEQSGCLDPVEAFKAGYEAGRLAVPRFDMARAMDQAMRARAVNGHPYAWVIRKRAGAPVSRAFFITEAGIAVPIMRALEEL